MTTTEGGSFNDYNKIATYMNGEYKEKMPNGIGDLIVSADRFMIKFYFSGSDMRYSGTFFEISEKNINEYIDAYEKNWVKYLSLKEKQSELGAELKTTGILGMNIYVGGIFDGICIINYHMPINNKRQLEEQINSFKWAKNRGLIIQKLLKSI